MRNRISKIISLTQQWADNHIHKIAPLVIIFFFRDLLLKTLSFSDFSPFTDDYKQRLNKAIYSWDDRFIGAYDPSTYQETIRLFFEFVSFGRSWLAQDLFLVTAFTLGYYGFYNLLKSFGVDNKIVLFFCPFIFLFNPGIAGEWVNGFIGAIIAYNISPWILFYINKSFESNKIKYLLALLLFIGVGFVHSQVSFWIFSWLGLYAIIKSIYSKNFKALAKILGVFIISPLLHLPMIIKTITYAGGFDSLDYLVFFQNGYSKSSLDQLLILWGNLYSHQTRLGYFDFNINLIFYIFPAIFLSYACYIISKRSRNIYNKNFIVVFTVFISILLLVTLLRFQTLNYLVEKKFFLVVSLRSPIKLYYSLSLFWALITSLSIYRIFASNYLNKFKRLSIKPIIALVLITSYIIPNYYIFSGNLGLKTVRGENSYYINDKYKELEKNIESLTDNNNEYYLYLPAEYPLILHQRWQEKTAFEIFGGSINGSSSNLKELYEDTICNDSNTISSYFKNIKYIVYDKNPLSDNWIFDAEKYSCKIETIYESPYIFISYDRFKTRFPEKSTKTVFNDENWQIIENPDYTYNELFQINGFNDDRIRYEKISPVKYEIDITSIPITYNNIINFNQNFHSGWKLFIIGKDGNKIAVSESYLFDEKYNSWNLDLDTITKTHPSSLFTINEDGENITTDIKLEAYFEPQSIYQKTYIASALLIAISLAAYCISKYRDI